MADTRINALSTATSSASDDFVPIDGTTNGTRKLSAYSPSFGGNATVGGTLTVNGTSGSVIAGNADTSLQVGAAAPYQRAAIGLSRRLNYGDALFARNLQGKTASDNYTTVGTDSGSGYVGFEAQYGGVARILLGTGATTAGADVTPTVALSASTSAVSIPLTTASTSTSSGALVVGNGTSGGLGVGGAIYAGGYLSTGSHARIGAQSSVVAFSANNNVDGGLPASWTGNYGVGVQYLGSSSNAFYLGDGSGGSTYFYTRTASANTARLTIDNTNGNTTVGGTLTVSSSVQSSAVFAANNTTLLLRPGGSAVTTGQLSIDTSGNANAEGIIGTSAASMRVTNTNGGFLIYKDATPTGAARFTYNTAAANTISLGVYDGASWTDPFRVTTTQALVTSTTASNSTSSGALVVGNGTSGGLGVGGAVTSGGGYYFGASADASLTRVAAGIIQLGGAATSRFDITGATDVGIGFRQTGARDWFVAAKSFELQTSCLSAGSIASYESGVLVRLRDTTASTSTSSGALVVSGGVGVAKELYVGTTLKLANTSQSVAAWGDIGAQLSVAGAVITDTSSSGTVSRAVVNSIAASALAASSTTTYTQAASLFVAGAPTANTNVTITNAYAIYTAGGRINFQGLPTSSAGLQAGTLWNDGGTLKVA